MTRIRFEGFCLCDALGSSISEANLRSNASRIALVGDWSAFFSYLMGRNPAQAGHLEFLGQDARQRVIEGSAAVVHPSLILPEEETVQLWLADQLQLLGLSAESARTRITDILSELEIGVLAPYRLTSLDGVQLFAVQVAAALMTEPKVIAIAQTPGVHAMLDFEAFLVDRAAQRRVLLLGCDPPEQLPLFLDCEEAWVIEADGSLRSDQPMETAGPAHSYELVAARNADALERILRTAGLLVHGTGGGELLVTLPAGKSTRELLQLAADADAPLSRMLPLQVDTTHVRSQNLAS